MTTTKEQIIDFITNKIDPDVQAIIRNGMYVMLDIHMYPDPEGERTARTLVQFARDYYLPVLVELAKKNAEEEVLRITDKAERSRGAVRLLAKMIGCSTYGWSAEEVLLKVFKTATDRNRYFGERIGKLLEKMGNNSIRPSEVSDELKELQEISIHLSDIDPMKTILNTIVETYK